MLENEFQATADPQIGGPAQSEDVEGDEPQLPRGRIASEYRVSDGDGFLGPLSRERKSHPKLVALYESANASEWIRATWHRQRTHLCVRADVERVDPVSSLGVVVDRAFIGCQTKAGDVALVVVPVGGDLEAAKQVAGEVVLANRPQ